MLNNKSLIRAKYQEKNEFYTQLCDIETELSLYKTHFKDKIVLCNCNDSYESNFFKYFMTNFNEFGLKQLIAISYDETPYSAHMINIKSVNDLGNNTTIPLIENGDFRSTECIEILQQADIIVTNPPFSLFREYFDQLIEHNKQFVIMGNQNAIGYKNVSPYIIDRRIWLGHDTQGMKWFRVPTDYDISTGVKTKDGIKYVSFGGQVVWFTNLNHSKWPEKLKLYKQYSPKEYPTYDSYDAIEVGKVADIPVDYDGIMGVPITFVKKMEPRAI